MFFILLRITAVPRDLKTMLMQNVGGQIQIGFIMGKVEVAYCEYSLSLTEKKTSYSIFLNR